MKNLFESMLIAFSMYSKIPMPKVEWNDKNMKYAMCFFPVIGVVIGVCVQIIGTLLIKSTFDSLFFSVIMTLLPVMITGGIHLDGFLDTIDALSSWGDKEKKLQILKDSNSGAFAIIGMGCYLLCNIALWSEASVEMLPLISCGYVLSRALSGYSVVTFQTAKNSGLAKTFQDTAQKKRVKMTMYCWIMITTGCMLVYNLKNAIFLFVAGALFFQYYKRLCKKQFGGITGDLAGYFLQVFELLMLGVIVLGTRLYALV